MRKQDCKYRTDDSFQFDVDLLLPVNENLTDCRISNCREVLAVPLSAILTFIECCIIDVKWKIEAVVLKLR